jgi:hypothetical protein
VSLNALKVYDDTRNDVSRCRQTCGRTGEVSAGPGEFVAGW